EGENRRLGPWRVEIGGGGGREGGRDGGNSRAQAGDGRRGRLTTRPAGLVPGGHRFHPSGGAWAAGKRAVTAHNEGARSRIWSLQRNNSQPISILARLPRPKSSRNASGSHSARCWSIGSAPTSRCPASIRTPGTRFSIPRPAAFSACSTC